VAGRLRYVSDVEPGITRKRSGRGFCYLDARGRRVRSERVLQRIRALAIPPAYTDVWICASPDGHLQATGRDARGRKQYRYHAAWRRQRDRSKFARTAAFGERLPGLRRRIRRDLRERGMARQRVLAALLRLLDRTRIRIGNEEYARSNRSFGLSTLRTRHVSVRGDEIRFAFRGKSGRLHEVAVEDPRVARTLRRCLELPGQLLFQYLDDGTPRKLTSSDINDYLRDAMGEEFTAKDFRTWSASVIVARELFAPGPERPPSPREAVRIAADALGNTPAVCQRAYVHPAVLEATAEPLANRRIRALFARTTRARDGLDRHERALLRYLRARA
jgi:DNA topoisomerase-1